MGDRIVRQIDYRIEEQDKRWPGAQSIRRVRDVRGLREQLVVIERRQHRGEVAASRSAQNTDFRGIDTILLRSRSNEPQRTLSVQQRRRIVIARTVPIPQDESRDVAGQTE